MSALAKLELSPQYYSSIASLSSSPAISDAYRAQSILKNLGSERWQRLSGFARAQALHDYVSLLHRDWNADLSLRWEPSPIALQQLKQRLSDLPNPANDELLIRLDQELDNTTIYPSFAAFQNAEGDVKKVDSSEYEQWLSRSYPYLVLGLSLTDPDAATEELQQRIQYFLSLMPEGLGMEETYTGWAWDYARAAYKELSRTFSDTNRFVDN